MAIALLFYIFMALVSIILITKGSDWATDSLIPVARRLGTTHVAVGLILVSVMVSLPEIIVAVYATLLGHFQLSIGVVIGSVICNIGLMTGLSAMIKHLRVSRTLILRDGIFAVTISIVVLVLSMDQRITRAEGISFILIFLPYLVNVWVQEKAKGEEEKQRALQSIEKELDIIGMPFAKLKAGFLSFILGIGLLLFASYLFSQSLINIARESGLSDLLIGLTIGAIGPSVPNIAAALQATVRNIDEVAVSETLGSNIFTLLVTLGILSIIRPIDIGIGWLRFDIPIMVLMSALLLIFMLRKHYINRIEGSILFFGYLLILGINIFLYT